MIKTFFLLVSCLSPILVSSFDITSGVKLFGPDELTNFLIDRFGGSEKWNISNWNIRSDEEVQDIFVKHGLRNRNQIPCLEANCKKRYTDEVEGSGTVKSTVSTGNETFLVNGEVGGQGKFILNLERDGKEEKHCLVVQSNTTLSNTGPNFSYDVTKTVHYGGGVRIRPLMADEAKTVNLEDDDEGLVRLHIIRASSKSNLEELTASQHYSDRFSKSSEVTATVVTFDGEACDNSIQTSVNCGTLARIYHHIRSSTERIVTYKEKTKSYKTESYGTIVTVVKKL